MKKKKEEFFKEMIEHGCAVLVGPMLEKHELFFYEETPLLIVDGGLDKLSKHAPFVSRSTFSVGDGDSSNSPMNQKIPCEKNFSDLAFALTLIPESMKSLELYGFLGGRKDHELANYGEVFSYLKTKNAPFYANFSHEVYILSAGKWQINHHGLFSLMAIEPANIIIQGQIKYKLPSRTQLSALSSLGLSNHAEGVFFLETDMPIILFADKIELKTI